MGKEDQIEVSGDDFRTFLVAQGWNDAEAMRRLGIGSHHTLTRYKVEGAPLTIALAMTAAARDLGPWKPNREPVYSIRSYDPVRGETVLSPGKSTAERIASLRSRHNNAMEAVPESIEYVSPNLIDHEGKYMPPSDADRFYLERLMNLATKNSPTPERVRQDANTTSHLHVIEGNGRRRVLLEMFREKAPRGALTEVILDELTRLAGPDL